MKIGIDISQIVYEGTGVGTYVRNLTEELLRMDSKNEYILFGSSFRRLKVFKDYFQKIKIKHTNVSLKIVPIPPKILHILWNIFHILPIEFFVGKIDVFWSSDWTQPPLREATGMTTIHDLTVLIHPESFSNEIVTVHKRKLAWSQKECSIFLCDSEATKKDANLLLGIPLNKLSVVYPGYKL